jgi:hypothetical protein
MTERSEARRTVIQVPLVAGLPQACQLYGHEREYGEFPGAKQCRVCGLLGFRPYCVFLPPPDAQPFRCSRHSPTARKGYA